MAAKRPTGPADLEKYRTPEHTPGRCSWQANSVFPGTCSGPSIGKYLGRDLCPMHQLAIKNIHFPPQLVEESLNFMPAEERGMLTFAQREATIKGMNCTECGRNCPDADATKLLKVWCWKCVLERKYVGAPELPTTRVHGLGGGAHKRAGPRAPRAANDVEVKLAEVASGKQSLVFEGAKGTNVFTAAGKGNVAVQDQKGVTEYEAANEDHQRILVGRLGRWLKKQEPVVKAGKVPVKGPKCEVRIKGEE